MRVIAGQFRSRPLRSLPGLDIRPTADRLRETLFNVLTAGNADALAGSTWADLYAGTGAVGIEALSRGAGKVLFVESSRTAAKLIGENLGSLQVASGFELFQGEVTKILLRWQGQGLVLDFVFLDPPYRLEKEYHATLKFLSESTLLSEKGIVIAEHASKFASGEVVGALRRYRKLLHGDAGLSFYRKE